MPGAAHTSHEPTAPRCEACEACRHDACRAIDYCELTGVQVVLDWPGEMAQVCPRTMNSIGGPEHGRLVAPVLLQIMARGKLGLWQRLTGERVVRRQSPGRQAAELRRVCG